MIQLRLHLILVFRCSPSLCLTWDGHSLCRYEVVGSWCPWTFSFVWVLIYSIFSQQVFNNSPDETAYFRMLLNRENVTNAAVMIQPSLIAYSFNAPPSPALLDVASIAADRILLLDAYFSVVIFHGMTVAQWRNMGYQNQPEHQVCPVFWDRFLTSLKDSFACYWDLGLHFLLIALFITCWEDSRSYFLNNNLPETNIVQAA